MAKQYCTTCGAIGRPRKVVRGSLIMELILWALGLASLLFFPLLVLLPIIYSAWRLMAHREKRCRSCGAETMIPLNSPIAQKALGDTTIE